MYPQTTYNGPPPNYVELELQIVPFLAATLYKFFGIQVVVGRLVSIAFSLATALVVAYFGRWLFASNAAGLASAFFFVVFPGSVYYGRTFMPDSAMVFFLTAALYSTARLMLEDESIGPRALARTAALLTFAYLAKPVAVLAVVPVIAAVWERSRERLTTRPTAVGVLLLVPLLILWLYDRRVASYAEWHWASGITTAARSSGVRATPSPALSAFAAKLGAFFAALGLLRERILGSAAFFATIVALIALPWMRARSAVLLWGWLAAGLLYVFVVVTVERVDYYMLPLVPLCALVLGGAAARLAPQSVTRRRRCSPGALGAARDRSAARGRRAAARACRRCLLLRLQPDRVSPRDVSRRNARPRRPGRHRALRPGRPILHRPFRLGGRPRVVDALRRGERDTQRRPLLHLDRGQPPATQRRPLRVPPTLPGARTGRAMDRLRNRSGQRTARRQSLLARIPQRSKLRARAAPSSTRTPRSAASAGLAMARSHQRFATPCDRL